MSFDLQPIQLNEAKWQAIRAKFAADGVDVPDESSGRVEYKGVLATFTWDGSILRITVIEKPWVTEGYVASQLTNYIQDA